MEHRDTSKAVMMILSWCSSKATQHLRGRAVKRKQNNFNTNLTITPVPFDLLPTQITTTASYWSRTWIWDFWPRKWNVGVKGEGNYKETGELLGESQGREAILNSSDRDRSQGFAGVFLQGLDKELEW